MRPTPGQGREGEWEENSFGEHEVRRRAAALRCYGFDYQMQFTGNPEV